MKSEAEVRQELQNLEARLEKANGLEAKAIELAIQILRWILYNGSRTG